MGLRREIIAIPLLGGLDSKTDAKLVAPGQLVDVQNAEYTKGGSLRKRAGYTAVPCELTDGTPITDALGVAALGDGWVLLGRRSAYIHDTARNAWVELGAFTPVTYTARELANVSAQQDNADLDSVNGVTLVAWLDSRGGIRCSVFDDASGGALVSDLSLIGADANLAKVAVAGPNMYVTWHNSNTDAIEGRILRTADVKAFASTANITLAANAGTGPQYDLHTGGDSVYLAYRQDAGVADVIQLVKFNSSGTATATTTAHSFASIVGPAVWWDSNTNRVYTTTWEDTAPELEVAMFDGADLTRLEDVSTGLSDVTAVGVALGLEGGPTVWTQHDVGGAEHVEAHNWDDTFNTVSHNLLCTFQNSRLVAGPYHDGHSNIAVLAVSQSPSGLQGAYYLCRDDGVTIGRLVYGSGHALTSRPHVKSLGDDRYTLSLGFRRNVPVNLAAVTGTPSNKLTPVYQHRGLKRIDLNHRPKLTPVEVNDVLYVNGAWLWAIDGAGPPTEGQMQQFPDVVAANHVNAAGGSLEADAAYSYRWYYEWTNGRGQRVRSMALTVTTATVGANRQFNITLPRAQFTRTDVRSPIAIVGYRTAADNPTFFYRVTSPNPAATGANGYVANPDELTATVSFTDNLSDGNLIQREIDYMSAGEVEHLAFDGPAVLGEAGNRLWCIGGGERPDNPQFSLLRADGSPPEGNDSFTVTEFPEDGGAAVAISHINGVPVVFRERAIYAIEGEGPFNNRDLAAPYVVRQLSSDVGCTEPRSVLNTSEGIYFKAAKGIYRLGQNLVPEYVGAFVEAYNSQDVTGAAIVPDTNQCVFLTSSGRTLMYDYFYQRWSTWTNHAGVSLASSLSGFAYLRNDGQLYVRDNRAPDVRVHTDANVPYVLRFRTGPIRLEGTIQGQWIARKVMAIGEYKSPHELQLSIYRNREAWPRQIVTWRPDDLMGLTLWGDDSVWGDDTVWGGEPRSTEYSFDAKLKARKNSTVSFELADVPGSPPGASYEMTELALEVWYQPGLARLAKSRKI